MTNNKLRVCHSKEQLMIENLTQGACQLFTLPDIAIKLQRLIYSDSSSADEMADLIALDPALTARLLRLANSSFYNFPAQIETVSRAVTLVGTNEIFNLALATAAIGAFRKIDNSQLDMEKFWLHSVSTGLIARNLLEQLKQKNSESAFVSGLLHNIGLLVLAEQEPKMLAEILTLDDSLAPWEREKSVLGFCLSDCSFQLLVDWNLPESLAMPLKYQHEPDTCSGELQLRSICLHLSTRAASSLVESNSGSTFDFIASIQPEVWELAQLEQANLQQAMDYAEQNSQQIARILTQDDIHSV